jgi:predicted nucleic acid-binding protein
MGLILDSSVVIAAERRGDTVEQLIEKIVKTTGDQEAALSAIGLTELLNELLTDLTVYPYTKESALLAGKIDGEQQSRGVVIPFGDLLIGATALSLGFKVLTGNLRDFQRIPGRTANGQTKACYPTKPALACRLLDMGCAFRNSTTR